MIQSMTAFSRHETQNSWGSAVWELRSINQRYLDINLRLPESLGVLEPMLREQIKTQLQRGKIDIYLRYQAPAENTNKLSINKELVAQLFAAGTEITEKYKLSTTSFNAMSILQWPGVLQKQEISKEQSETLENALKTSFIQALNILVTARTREGAALQTFMEQRLHTMQMEIDKLKPLLPHILKNQREKLLSRLEENKITVNPERLEQEIVFFAQKIDITEEIERLETHIQEMQQAFKQGGAIGRRMDFLLQEANREANTLASKSVITETTLASVELKILIEQIREQIQNIE